MLTKQDLNSIGTIVRTELAPVRNDITNLQKDMTVVKKDIKKLRKDLTRTIDFFDKSGTETREKLNKTRKDLRLKEVEFAY